MSITPRRAALVAPLLLLGLGLNGCGISDNEVRPGVAAQVDGTDVTSTEVDDLVSGTCDYLDDTEGAAAYPRVTVRRLFLETLIRREAAEQLVDDLDAELPGEYDTAIAGLAQDYADVPDDVAATMREGDRARYYVAYATAAIGDALLREETGAEPADADAIGQRGNKAIADWIADHDVALNPTYGLRLQDGAFVADDGLSVAVSTQAQDARAIADIDLSGASGDQATLQASLDQANASLSDEQVCGTPGAPQG